MKPEEIEKNTPRQCADTYAMMSDSRIKGLDFLRFDIVNYSIQGL